MKNNCILILLLPIAILAFPVFTLVMWIKEKIHGDSFYKG